jgi:hypothetical protein
MKPWWRSRTLWLNAIAVALLALEARFALLQPLLPVNVYALFATALPVVNAVLRLITTTALSVSPSNGEGDASR